MRASYADRKKAWHMIPGRKGLARVLALLLCLMLLPFNMLVIMGQEQAGGPSADTATVSESPVTSTPEAATSTAVTTESAAATDSAAATPAAADASATASAAATPAGTSVPAATSPPAEASAPAETSAPDATVSPAAATTPAPVTAALNAPADSILGDATPAPTPVILTPTDDLQVQNGQPLGNQGSKDTATVVSSTDLKTYTTTGRLMLVKFDLSGLQGQISNATLRLYQQWGASKPLRVAFVDDPVFTQNCSEASTTFADLQTAGVEPSRLITLQSFTSPATNPSVPQPMDLNVTLGAQIAQRVADFGGKAVFVIYQWCDSNNNFTSQGTDICTKEWDYTRTNGNPNTNLGGQDPATHRPRLILQLSDTPDSNISAISEDIYTLNSFMKNYRGFLTDPIPLNTLTLPNASKVTWTSSNTAYLDTQGNVTRPPYKTGDQVVTFTAKVTKGAYTQTISYIILIKAKDLTDQDRVQFDFDYISSQLDKITTTQNITFPTSLPYGSTVTYVSNDPAHLKNDGTVTRPGVNENSAVVAVTANLTYGTASLSKDVTIYIPKVQSDMTAYVKKDLENILAAAKKLIATPNHIYGNIVIEPKDLTPESNIPSGDVVGDLWGQYPQSAYDAFKAVIDHGDAVLANPDGEYSLYYNTAESIIKAGAAFIRSANLDNTVLIQNQQDNKLVFSSYRRELMAYRWLAQTTLMLEEYYYPDSAKQALQKEIDRATEVLDYTYKFPYVRSRGYIVPRPDEHIRQVLQRYAKRYTEGTKGSNSTDGIIDTLAWYKNQHVLLDAYEEIKLVPTDDTYIASGSPNTNYGSATNLQPGGNTSGDPPTNTAFIKFDLSPYKDKLITSAEFRIWQYWTPNTVKTNFYVLTDPGLMDWSEKTFTYNVYNSTKTYSSITNNSFITQLSIGGANDNVNGRLFSFSALDAVKSSLNQNETRFTIVMYTPSKLDDPTITDNRRKDYWSKEWTDQTKIPCIVIKINNVPMQKLIDKYNFVMAKAQELVGKAKNGQNVGTQVGNYLPEDYDALLSAMNNATAAIKEGDCAKVGMALVALYNAMRKMSDNQVLRTNIDPNANLYFTKEDKLNMVKKITSMPNLAAFYSSQKANADQTKLSDYQDRLALLNPAMTYDEFDKMAPASFSNFVSGANPKSPANAAYASFKIVLPSENNTQDANAYNAEMAKLAGGVNYANRVGSIWIDNITFNDSNGVSVVGDDNNLSFEKKGSDGMPLNWELTSDKGSPVYKIEDRPKFVNSGAYSVYVENPTPNDQAVLKYYVNKDNYVIDNNGQKDYLFDIDPNMTFTFNANVKQEGFLVGFDSSKPSTFYASGTQFIISFYDANKKLISQSVSKLNKKSGYSGGGLGQADSIAYLVTKDITYAQKAKYNLLIGLNDFCQGAESWKVNNERPYGIDAYGEVQAGRYLVRAMSVYAMIEDANVFTDEEFKQFVRMVEYVTDFCQNTHDQTTYDDSIVASTGNWETDMYAGSALAAMALREPDPNKPGQMRPILKGSKQMIDNATWLLSRQMNLNIANSGAYSESIRYLWAAYSRVTTLAKALINNMNDNWFEYTKLPRIFDFVVQVQTPPYKYLRNAASAPNYGDCNIGEGAYGFALLGQYFKDVGKVNPTLGAQMLETWKRAGQPIGCDGEGALISAFFVPLDVTNHDNIPLDLTSTDYYHQKSPIIMRNNQGRDNETYICAISSTDGINHRHQDQGSFMLMSGGSYLVVDMGIESYFDAATKAQYQSSSNHSAFTFYKSNSGIDYSSNVSKGSDGKDVIDMTVAANHINTGQTPDYSELQASSFSDPLDMIKIHITPGTGGGDHYRNMAFVKQGLNALVIWDQVKNNSAINQFNIPTAAKQTIINGNKVISVGHYDMNLETTFLLPKDAGIVYDRIRANSLPVIDGYDFPTVDVVRSISRHPGENHLTVLYPLKKGAVGLTTTEIATGNAEVVAYKIQNAQGLWVIIAANNSDESQSVDLGSGLIDMQTGMAYTGSIPANTLIILKPSSLGAPVPNALEVSGPALVLKPNGNVGLKYNYQAILLDQYGNKMTGLNKSLEVQPYVMPSQLPPATGAPANLTNNAIFTSPHPLTIGRPKVKWSINPAVAGLSIDDNGILTVNSNVSVNSITLVAQSNGVTSNYQVIVGDAATSYADSLAIVGPTTIGVDPNKTTSVQYGYKVYDQFGSEMKVGGIVWSLSANDTPGITISDSGLLTISPDALSRLSANGVSTITLTAYSLANTRLKDVLSVVLEYSKGTNIVTDVGSKIQVPKTGTWLIRFNANLVNQNNVVIENGATFSWELSGDNLPAGLSIKPDTGELTIPAGIGEIQFDIVVTANLNDGNVIKQAIPVSTTTDPIIQRISISGLRSITAGDSNQDVSYKAAVYDQLGQELKDQAVTWSASNLPYGVAFNKQTATLTVQSTAGDGKVMLKAQAGNDVNATYEVQINKNPSAPITDNGKGSKSGGIITGGGAASSGDIVNTNPVNANPQAFKDVPVTYWCYKYIQDLAAKGKIKGSGDSFRPNDNITRAEFVQMIVNVFGLEGSEGNAGFADVSSGDWFYKALAVASGKGLINGYSDGTFHPYDNITRQDMSVIIKRVIDYKNIALKEKAEKKVFKDEASYAAYAKDAIEAMQKAGLIDGYDDGTFKPLNYATRGEAAKIMYCVDNLN